VKEWRVKQIKIISKWVNKEKITSKKENMSSVTRGVA
jgi:hypothetical protein